MLSLMFTSLCYSYVWMTLKASATKIHLEVDCSQGGNAPVFEPTDDGPVLLCFSTEDNHFVREWYSAARKQGWKNFMRIGRCEPWTGFGTKVRAVKRALSLISAHDPARLVISADVFDLLINNSPQAALEAFASYSPAPVVVAAESRCGPNCEAGIATRCGVSSEVKRRYINGGFAMGRAGALLEIYNGIEQAAAYDDQIGFAAVWKANCSVLALDSQQKLAHVLYEGQLDDLTYDAETEGFRSVHGQPVAVHMLFQALDFGARRNAIGSELVEGFQSDTHLNGFRQLLAHITKHSYNPVYGILRNTIVPALALLLLLSGALIVHRDATPCQQGFGNAVLILLSIIYLCLALSIAFPYEV